MRGLAPDKPSNRQVVARNRKAKRDFHIEETIEAGIELTGTEVKAAREGNVSLQEAYAMVEGREVFLHNMHIGPYRHGNIHNHEPKRTRRLLLHRKEIDSLYGRVRQQGYTLVPLSMYFKRGWAKVEIAVAKGKSYYDKREKIKKEEAKRRMDRAVRRPY